MVNFMFMFLEIIETMKKKKNQFDNFIFEFNVSFFINHLNTQNI